MPDTTSCTFRHGVHLQPDGSHEVYNGLLKALPLRDFLDNHASTERVVSDAAGGAAGPEGLMEPQLHSLTADNLTDIDSGSDMWLVAFYTAQGELPGCSVLVVWGAIDSMV